MQFATQKYSSTQLAVGSKFCANNMALVVLNSSVRTMVLLINLEFSTPNNKCDQFDQSLIHSWHGFEDEFNRSTASEDLFPSRRSVRKIYRSVRFFFEQDALLRS
ncbi:hypothetical protein TNCV_4671411 [Trichonephila clavipes]|nr:hypothetical protein TNCV_4671411 [Trichonephila clavipes]